MFGFVVLDHFFVFLFFGVHEYCGLRNIVVVFRLVGLVSIPGLAGTFFSGLGG